MLFLAMALCSAVIVRSSKTEPSAAEVGPADEEDKAADKGSTDPWCCCDSKKVTDEEKMVCLTADGHRTLLGIKDYEEADTAADGYSVVARVLVEDKIVRSCSGEAPQPCVGECVKERYITFSQRERTGKFDREYELPVGKWKAAKYHSKYYSEKAQGRKHVLETESGNVYAKVDDASKHGLAKNEPKFCTRYETYAYWKFAETDEDDWFYESGYKHAKNSMNAWSCVEKKKCVQYVTVEDACGKKNVVRGDGEEKPLEGGVGGELYELVGRKGQCEDPEKKEGTASGAWKWMKETTGSAGAGSQCPSGMFHSSKGKQASPDIPYRFCDCDGECK